MSYNILAQNLLEDNPYLYTTCEDDFLDWEYRQQKLLCEIKRHYPDVSSGLQLLLSLILQYSILNFYMCDILINRINRILLFTDVFTLNIVANSWKLLIVNLYYICLKLNI